MNEMLQKLEDSVLNLIGEVEQLRGKVDTLTTENAQLKDTLSSSQGQSSSEQAKLQSILSLLDDVDGSSATTTEAESTPVSHSEMSEEVTA
jgi:hypothetical protein